MLVSAWAALELGAWVACATGSPRQLIGATSDQRSDGRDASRVVALGGGAGIPVVRTAPAEDPSSPMRSVRRGPFGTHFTGSLAVGVR